MIYRLKSQFMIDRYRLNWKDAHSKEIVFSGGGVINFVPDILNADIYFGYTISVSAVRCGVGK